jgi:hypothetical protein
MYGVVCTPFSKTKYDQFFGSVAHKNGRLQKNALFGVCGRQLTDVKLTIIDAGGFLGEAGNNGNQT